MKPFMLLLILITLSISQNKIGFKYSKEEMKEKVKVWENNLPLEMKKRIKELKDIKIKHFIYQYAKQGYTINHLNEFKKANIKINFDRIELRKIDKSSTEYLKFKTVLSYAIIRAKVKNIEQLKRGYSRIQYTARVEFEVLESFKGDIKDKSIFALSVQNIGPYLTSHPGTKLYKNDEIILFLYNPIRDQELNIDFLAEFDDKPINSDKTFTISKVIKLDKNENKKNKIDEELRVIENSVKLIQNINSKLKKDRTLNE